MAKTINTRTKYRIVGSDYSAQEPRMTAFLSNDPTMYKAYVEGKDLYAMIACSAFDNNYEDNLEFWPEGTELEIDGQKVIAGHKTHLNKDGKARRSVGKVLNLAATYGMSGATAGARLGKSREEGQKLLDNFFNGFKGVKTAIDDSKAFLDQNGYVEDFIGRRRRLKDIRLDKYTITLKDGSDDVFNPFLICGDRITQDPRVVKWKAKIDEAVKKSQNFQAKKAAEAGRSWIDNGEMSNKQFKKLAAEALQEGVILQANTGRIAQASRQCFNARIQGSAATLTKLAMIDIANDKTLNDCDTKLIIPVHDELLVECPEYYSDIVEKRLPEVMINAAKRGGDNIPQSCDPYNVTRWYSDTAAATIMDEFKKLESKGQTRDEAFATVIANHSEVPEEAIKKTIETGCDLDF